LAINCPFKFVESLNGLIKIHIFNHGEFQKCDGMVILIEGNYNDLCVVNFCRERERG
jgi:hypothetical protein